MTADFCPKCGSILIPNNKSKGLVCSCGYKTRGKRDIKVSERINSDKEGSGVFEQEEETMSKTKQECPECHYGEAFFWTQQTRSADEPETMFYRCCKCRHTWREYA